MNVVQVTYEYAPAAGGSAVAVRDLQRALGGSVISFGRGSGATDALEVGTAAFLPARAYGWQTPRALRAAARSVGDAQLVICHLLFRYHVQWAVRLCRRAGVPYWLVPHGSLDPVALGRSAVKRGWLEAVGRRAFRDASLTLFATAGELRKARPWAPARTAVLPWPVDPPPGIDRPAARAAVRAQLGIPGDAFVVLFVGRLHPIKQPLAAIEALARCGVPDAHLVVLGPEDALTTAACERHAAAVGATHVHLAGGVYGAEKWPYFAAADAFLALSLQENFGYAIAEALACGLPAVLPAALDIASDGLPGTVLLRAADAATAAGALARLAAMPEAERRELGRRGAAWVQRSCSRARFEQSLGELAAASAPRRQAAGARIGRVAGYAHE